MATRRLTRAAGFASLACAAYLGLAPFNDRAVRCSAPLLGSEPENLSAFFACSDAARARLLLAAALLLTGVGVLVATWLASQRRTHLTYPRVHRRPVVIGFVVGVLSVAGLAATPVEAAGQGCGLLLDPASRIRPSPDQLVVRAGFFEGRCEQARVSRVWSSLGLVALFGPTLVGYTLTAATSEGVPQREPTDSDERVPSAI